MARPGFTGHRKYARLTRLLGSAPLALGCLELMWEKCCINGDDYLGDVVDVEAAAQWPGEPGLLCRSLLDAGGEDRAGFIEEDEGHPGHYRCHDFYDHAPRYVARRMEREAERRERGQTLSDLRAEAGSKGGKQTASKRPANGQQNDSKRKQTAVPPAPAPAPAPLKTCAEPAEADSTPVVLSMPCVAGKTWPLTEGRLAKWRETFPHLDVMQEARKMLLYLEDNPAKRKTFGGMGKFTGGWLGRAQDSGGSRASPWRGSSSSPPQGAIAADVTTMAKVQQIHIPKLARVGGS